MGKRGAEIQKLTTEIREQESNLNAQQAYIKSLEHGLKDSDEALDAQIQKLAHVEVTIVQRQARIDELENNLQLAEDALKERLTVSESRKLRADLEWVRKELGKQRAEKLSADKDADSARPPQKKAAPKSPGDPLPKPKSPGDPLPKPKAASAEDSQKKPSDWKSKLSEIKDAISEDPVSSGEVKVPVGATKPLPQKPQPAAKSELSKDFEDLENRARASEEEVRKIADQARERILAGAPSRPTDADAAGLKKQAATDKRKQEETPTEKLPQPETKGPIGDSVSALVGAPSAIYRRAKGLFTGGQEKKEVSPEPANEEETPQPPAKKEAKEGSVDGGTPDIATLFQGKKK